MSGLTAAQVEPGSAAALLEELALLPDDVVVDVGAGWGGVAALAASRARGTERLLVAGWRKVVLSAYASSNF